MSGNANKSSSSGNERGIDNSSAEDVCDRANIGALSLEEAHMSFSQHTKRDVSAVEAIHRGTRPGTSATAETTGMMQELSLADTATKSRDLSETDSRRMGKLRECLAFLIDRQIPQAEQDVQQRRRAANRLSGKTMMHRVYYDKAVSAQHGLDWLYEAREVIEKALDCGSVMAEYEMLELEHVESVLLLTRRDDEAEKRYAAELEEGMEE